MAHPRSFPLRATNKEMLAFFGSRLTAAISLAIMALNAPAFAQVVPPPPHNARDATGVSYRGGAFSFEEEDLSVAGGLPNGLSLTRSYNSGTAPISDPYTAAYGWTNNFDIYITVSPVPHYPYQDPGPTYPAHYREVCIWSVAGGPGSTQFVNGGGDTGNTVSIGCGNPLDPGPPTPVVATGQSLEWITTSTPNYFKFTNSDGSVITFTPGATVPRASVWTMPDGTRLDFNYTSIGALQSVFSNRGWAVLFESKFKTCIVNIARTYVTATSTCPSDAQTATYSYSPGLYNTGIQLLTSATTDITPTFSGNTRTYQYAGADHVSCILDPGASACRIQNSYSHCPEDPQVGGPVQSDLRRNDSVTSQTDASGRTYTYTYAFDLCPQWQQFSDPAIYPDYRPWQGMTTTVAETGIAASTTVDTDDANQVTHLKDPLARDSYFGYATSFGAPDGFAQIIASGELSTVQFTEGNQLSYTYDARANQTSSTAIAKPNSGLANISTSSSFPTTCPNVITCNKPASVTDARGNVTNYTYDPTHGGVLTETGPADSNGVSPVKRYAYVQRSAWLANSSGSYSASPYPVWLVSEMRTCRTTATVGSACAGGSPDEVVTTYDYGPNSGPNNLLLRGLVVTADGTSRRTCYGYDANGRKISETKPNANLTVCP